MGFFAALGWPPSVPTTGIASPPARPMPPVCLTCSQRAAFCHGVPLVKLFAIKNGEQPVVGQKFCNRNDERPVAGLSDCGTIDERPVVWLSDCGSFDERPVVGQYVHQQNDKRLVVGLSDYGIFDQLPVAGLSDFAMQHFFLAHGPISHSGSTKVIPNGLASNLNIHPKTVTYGKFNAITRCHARVGIGRNY